MSFNRELSYNPAEVLTPQELELAEPLGQRALTSYLVLRALIEEHNQEEHSIHKLALYGNLEFEAGVISFWKAKDGRTIIDFADTSSGEPKLIARAKITYAYHKTKRYMYLGIEDTDKYPSPSLFLGYAIDKFDVPHLVGAIKRGLPPHKLQEVAMKISIWGDEIETRGINIGSRTGRKIKFIPYN